MHLSHLRYFQAIARHHSLSAAARALRVSQPTLTHAIQSLEEEFHTQLLHRGRDGIRLTSAGETLVRHAGDVLGQVERMEQALHGLQNDQSGRFMLGCHESLGAYFLPGFMARFLESSPHIELTLWNGTSSGVRDAVLSHDVHFGLIVNPLQHPDLVLVKLFNDAMDFFVCDDGSESESLTEARARLVNGPLIFAGRVLQSREVIEQLAALGEPPKRLLSCGDLELVKSLTLAGLGVGVLPRRVADYNVPGKLRRLHAELPFIPDTIYLAFREDLHRTRAATHLKDALIAYGRALPTV